MPPPHCNDSWICIDIYWHGTIVEESIATMMKTRHNSVLFFLLSLCTLIIGQSIKNNDHGLYNSIIRIYSGNVKAGSCPPQRYYIKGEHEICHKLCMKDSDCDGSSLCCPDNCHTMCKPPVQEKPGSCPSYESAFSSAEACNDNCTTDAECSGTLKCCRKTCGKTCVPSLTDIAKPSTQSTESRGFCPQEEIPNCAIKERRFCDEASCLNGYKCCPKICRWECQKSLQERAGECPTSCPSQTESKACSSDYDCSPLYKCCTTCGNRCVKAVNVPSFLHNSTSSLVVYGGGGGR